jgi:hypothetical protein
MSYTPTRTLASSAQSNSESDNAQHLATRLRVVLSLNPYMSEKPDAALALAQSDLSFDELLNQAPQQYGMMVGNDFAQQLRGMPEPQQRGVWARLPKMQQMALGGVGYNAPPDRGGGMFSELLGGVAGAAGTVIEGGLNAAQYLTKPVVGPTLDTLEWVGNWPGHLYRSIRLMDDTQQWLGLAGAVAGGAAALALAPITFGGSLAVMGAVGGAALLGGTAGAAVTSPMDWWRAFDDSWNGERTFDRAARSRADELLGDPRLVGYAEDLAQIDGLSLDDLAVEMAAMNGGTSEPGRLRAMNELSSRMGAEGSPEYTQAFQAMLNTLQIPQFVEAVEALQNGKMSPGRDFADIIGQDQGTKLYNAISGTIDLAFTLAVDPILMLGMGSKAYRAHKLGVKLVEGSDFATMMRPVLQKKNVIRLHDEVVDAFNGADGKINTLRLRQISPEWERAVPELRDHMEVLRLDLGENAPMTREILQEFLIGSGQASPILRGIGGVRGAGRIIVRDYQPLRQAYREFSSDVRSFTHGLADPSLERRYRKKVLKAANESRSTDVLGFMPPGMDAHLTADGLVDTPWKWNEANPAAMAAGRRVGQVLPDWMPIGQMINMISTMAPAGWAVALSGERAPSQIRAMTELGSFFGMPSYVRRMWSDAILSAPSGAARQELALGFVDNAMTLAGGRDSARLAEFTDEFLTKSRQIYGFDDMMMLNGKMRHVGMMSSHNADELVMPSLKQIRKVAMTGNMARLVGIGDLDIFEAGVNKIWKPAVLLRLAFIPRAAGEEMLAFFLRSGIGALGQQTAARSIADRRTYRSAVDKYNKGLAVDMSPGERALHAKGPLANLPAHVRVLARMLDQTDWRDPAFTMLERYGEFIDNAVLKGIGRGRVTSVEALADPTGLSATRRAAVRNLDPPRNGTAAARPFSTNTRDNTNRLLLGNKYSWRRMYAGGIHNDMVIAAEDWAHITRTSIMRNMSTTNTGALEHNSDPRHVEVRMIRNEATGKVTRTEWVNIPGERVISNRTDDAYNGHLHRRYAEAIEDDLQAAAIQRHVILVKGKVQLADEEILEILEPLRRMPAAVRGIANEFLSNPNRDTFNAMINWLGARHPEMAESLKMLPNLRGVTFDEVVDNVRRFTHGLPRPWEDELEALARAQANDPDIVDADVIEPEWLREALDAKALTPEQIERRAIERAARVQGDPDPDELDWARQTDQTDWSAMDPHNRNRRTGDVDDIDEGWADEYAMDEPGGGWTATPRGAMIDPSGTTSPRRLRQLEEEYNDAVRFEMEEHRVRFAPDETEIATYRDERMAQYRQEVESIGNELTRFAGEMAGIDARTGLVVLHMRAPTNEDAWRYLTANQRRWIAMRYMRNPGGPSLPMDVIANQSGLTSDEWFERFFELTRAYDRARAQMSTARKMSRRKWRVEFTDQSLAEIERYRPSRAIEDIGLDIDETTAALERGRRAREARGVLDESQPNVEPPVITVPSKAELEQARLASLEDTGPPADLDDFSTPEDPWDQRRRLRAEDDEARKQWQMDDANIPPNVWDPAADPGVDFVPTTYEVEVDPVTMDDFYRLLVQIQPSMARIASLNDYERGFVGSLARSMDRPGSGFRLADLKRSVEVDDFPSPFYANLDEAMPDITRTLAAEALNPHRNEAAQNMIRLQNDAKDPALKGAVVQLYAAPSFRGIAKLSAAAGKPFGWEQILAAANDKPLIHANRDVVEKLLAMNDRELLPALADLQLARELRAIDGKLKRGGELTYGDVTMVPMPRTVLDGRMHDGDGLIPLVKRRNKGRDETQLWSMRSNMYSHRFVPLPRSVASRAEELAVLKAEELRKLFGRNTRSYRHARMRTRKDGSQEPLVYLRGPDGVTRPVLEDQRISQPDAFFDKNGQQISNEDSDFWQFGGAEAEDQADPVWEVLGSLVEDMWDSRVGGVRMLPKQSASFSAGRLVESSDSVRVYRSKKDHVSRIGDGRPEQIWGEKMMPTAAGRWDRFVRWGFDKVIGGAIDAIARRPMAFHYFQLRHTENMELMKWVVDPVLATKMDDLERQVYGLRLDSPQTVARHAATAKRVAAHHGADVTGWGDTEALAWLRGQNVDDLQTMLKSSLVYGRANKDRELAAGAAAMLREKPARILSSFQPGNGPQAFLRYVESQLPPGALTHPGQLRSPESMRALQEHESLRHFTDEDWDAVLAFATNQRHIRETARDAAAIAAINDMAPFIDSHEFKTQFAEYGKGFLPFWYAEENFMKRWVRGMIDAGPAYIRRAQLGYMGLKQAGIVRTDEQGKDWFVYPGSTLLADAIGRIHPTLGLAASGIMFQTPTDAMLPGVNNRFGAPAFNPLVTLPIDFFAALMPELKPVEAALSGKYGDRSALEQVVPSFVLNIAGSLTGDEHSNSRYASAMFAAMAQLEANGEELPDNASAGQRDEHMRKIRNHARIIVIAQAAAGFFTPGPPSAINAGQTASITGLGVENPAEIFSATYLELVRGLGIEQGTIEFLRLYPDASLEDVVAREGVDQSLLKSDIDVDRAIAYTQGRAESASGAQLGATNAALEWYSTNSDYLSQLPNAGPWLLPQEYLDGRRSEYAYDTQTVSGLRRRMSPDEFLTSMKFKEGAGEYFAVRDAFNNKIAQAQGAEDVEQVRTLKARWEMWSGNYRAAHPIFEQELVGGDGRERRLKIIDEMRIAVADPKAPASTRLNDLRNVMNMFDQYQVRLSMMAEDRTAKGRADLERFKARYANAMGVITQRNPKLSSFWASVLRPEASLD